MKPVTASGVSAAKVVATTSRKKALEGADAVLCTILAGDVKVWQHDILIPKKYGVDTNVGDTRGPSGVFRALRTIPVMLDIVTSHNGYHADTTRTFFLGDKVVQGLETVGHRRLGYQRQGFSFAVSETSARVMHERSGLANCG